MNSKNSIGQSPESNLGDACRYVDGGKRLVLLHEPTADASCSCGNARGGCPSKGGADATGKHPREKGWLDKLITDRAAVHRAWGRYATANIGMCPLPEEFVLDVDPRNGGAKTMARLEADLGPLAGPLARTGGGGCHHWLRLPSGIKVDSVKAKIARRFKEAGGGVDLRTCHHQVVVPPSIHQSGKRYEWVEDRSILECDPVVPNQAWLEFLGIYGKEPESKRSSSPPRVEERDFDRAEWGLVHERLLDPDSGYDSWFRVGSALRALGDDGLRLWIEFSKSSEQFDEDEIRRKWPGIAGSSIASLFGMFDDADPGWRQRYRSRSTSPIEGREGAAGRVAGGVDRRHGASLVGPASRVTVLVPGDHASGRVGIDRFVEQALRALPPGALYRRGGQVGEVVRERGQLKFDLVDEHRLRAVIDQHMHLVTEVASKQREDVMRRFKPCSRDLSAVVLSTARTAPGLRELRGIVSYPAFDSSLEILQPGWNECGIVYDRDEELADLQPQPEGALAVLEDLLFDFPFADDASRQNVIGMMLTALCREAIDGSIPFHLVHAPLERTGKGLLINTAFGRVILGRDDAPVLQLGRTEEEREKRITSSLLAGTTLVHFDNLPPEEVLDSPGLASLGTSRVWSGRLLGKSALTSLDNTLIVVMSGNNPKVTSELAKRTVPIRLQPVDGRPENRRDFKHPDIRRYAKERRRAALEALLGIVFAWRDAGSPIPSDLIRMGGFEQWARVVGAALHHAGATAWMMNYSSWVRQGDDFNADAEALVDKWWNEHGKAEVKSTEAMETARSLGIFESAFAGPDSGHAARFSRRVLGPLRDRPVGRFVVRRRGSGGTSLYHLEEAAR
ncbi:MAG: bifunctional DNA primase/polymerase [Planctomycetota bacterium]